MTPTYLFHGAVSNRSHLKPSVDTGLLQATGDRSQAVDKAIELRLQDKWPSVKVSRKVGRVMIDVVETEPLLNHPYLFNMCVYIADIIVKSSDKWFKLEHASGWATKEKVFSISSMEKVRIRTLLPNLEVVIRQGNTETSLMNAKFATPQLKGAA